MNYPLDESGEHNHVELPFDAAEISPLVKSISDFNVAQDNIEKAIILLGNPDANNQNADIMRQKLRDAMNASIQTFVSSVGHIIVDFEDDTQSATVAGLLLGSEERRHDFLCTIDFDDSVEYEASDYYMIQAKVDSIFFNSASEKEIQVNIAMLYIDMLDKDGVYIERRFREIRLAKQDVKHNETPNAEVAAISKNLFFKRRFGRRAVIAAAITAGASGAFFAHLLNLKIR